MIFYVTFSIQGKKVRKKKRSGIYFRFQKLGKLQIVIPLACVGGAGCGRVLRLKGVKQVDRSGAIQYTPIQWVQQHDPAPVFVFPNPATDKLWVVGASNLKSATLFDAQGSARLQWTNRAVVFDIHGLATGSYWLKIQYQNGTSSVEPIVKQ